MRAVFLTFGGGDVLDGALRGWSANGGGPVELLPLDELDDLPEADVVCFPELGMVEDAQFRLDAQRRMVAACERRGGIAVLDSPPGLSPQEVLDWRTSVQMIDSPNAVLYYPWIREGDEWLPPCGHVAGAWARVARENVMASVGGVELIDVVDVAADVMPDDQRVLHEVGVSVLRALPGWGIRAAGARTLSSEPWLFRVSTARLLAALKPEVTRLCVALKPTALDTMATAIGNEIASLAGQTRDAVWVRCEPVKPGSWQVRIELGERITAGYPLSLRLDHPEGTWSVTGTEPAQESSPQDR